MEVRLWVRARVFEMGSLTVPAPSTVQYPRAHFFAATGIPIVFFFFLIWKERAAI